MSWLRLVYLWVRRSLWRRRHVGRAWFVPTTLTLSAVELLATLAVLVPLAPLLFDPVGVLLLSILVALWLPHWLIELVAVPRGWPRVARVLGWADPRGDDRWRVLVEARAVARAGSPAADVERLLARLPTRLDGLGVVAHALVAAGRGDRDDARGLLRSALELPGTDPASLEIAGEWLAIDAAERGAWDELGAVSERWPVTATRYLLEGVAARRAGEGPGSLALALRWLATPRRLAVARYLRARPSAAPTTTDADSATSAPTIAPTAPAALLAWAERQGAADATAAAVAAWAATVDDPTWTERQIARAVALGVDPAVATATADAARAHLVARLVALCVATRPPLAIDAPGLAGAVAYRARGQLLDGLDLVLTRCERRDGQRPAIDEWRDFLAVRASYEATVGDDEALDRLAFPHANSALCSWAVVLWNERGQHVLSHAISGWLYARARQVGDAAAIETHGSNLALVIP